MNKKLLEEEIESIKYSLINNSFSFFKLPEFFIGENDSKLDNNDRFLKLKHLSNKNILELNEIKKEFKKSIVGQKIVFDINPTKSYLMDDIMETKTINLIDENEKEKYRILTRKGYVYDSFDDEENIDEINYNLRLIIILYILIQILFYILIFLFLFLHFII